MTLDIHTQRRIPRTLIATAWAGTSPLTADLSTHAGLAQHQLMIGCTGTPSSAVVTVAARAIGSGFFANVGTINLSGVSSGRLLFSGIFDAIQLTVTPAFSGITAAVQLDSQGTDFLLEGPQGGSGPTGPTGPVSSVGLAAPSFLTVTGSPVTSSGTLTLALASQSQNEVFASPSGAAGAPGFRSLVLGDLPAGVGELAAAQTWTGANTYTEGLQINGGNATGGQVALNANGTGYNTILRNDGFSFYILLSGSTGGSFNSFRPFAIDLSTAALTLDASGAGAKFGGAIYNHIGTVAAYSAVAPSAVTVGASPWVYQNTNAYGVFLHIYGVTAVGSSLQVSKDNSTYVTVASGGADESTYVPPGFYAKFTFSTAPSGASIVPV